MYMHVCIYVHNIPVGVSGSLEGVASAEGEGVEWGRGEDGREEGENRMAQCGEDCRRPERMSSVGATCPSGCWCWEGSTSVLV